MTSTTDNSELDALYRRAIADPTSLSQAETNTVLRWLSPEDDDRLCRDKTGGKSRADLIAQALAHPEQLTKVECALLRRSGEFVMQRPPPTDDPLELVGRLANAVDRLEASYREPPAQPYHDAYKAVWAGAIGDQEKRAIEAAGVRERVFMDEEAADWQRFVAEERLRAKRRTGTRWIRDMLRKGFDRGCDCWGFVCFRTGGYDDGDKDAGGDSAWARFQEYYWQTAETVLLEWGSGDRLWPLLRTIFVSDPALDGAPTNVLRARFKAMVEAGEVQPGIRRDCFLVVDDEAINSDETKRPYTCVYNYEAESFKHPTPTVFVRAVHADYPDIGPCLSFLSYLPELPPPWSVEGQTAAAAAATVDPMAGFTGEVTLALPKVFDFLIYALSDPEGRVGGWEAIYHQTEVPTRYTSVFNPADSAPTYARQDLRPGQGAVFIELLMATRRRTTLYE
ncbi:hypothetical protein CONLIGDRAFT_676821 [Coniochaeta ligniaria NRRL 30616]|uniref:Uncharacterized protein n=1 Tax=Coniochaeta ligniaria NRRL 30616 TaxID=1408157 RepID=A0A1J7IZV2_9PEZI|nr:hypothetical protein CONLIGDRAFT_676821 [Coniochaeta ligniaria NRRL 30616]